MNDEEKPFRAAIADHPDDNAPRLAYAHWLRQSPDAHGQARGEFIPLQIEIDELLRPANDTPGHSSNASLLRRQALIEANPQLQALIAREDALLRKHAIAWLKRDLGEDNISDREADGNIALVSRRAVSHVGHNRNESLLALVYAEHVLPYAGDATFVKGQVHTILVPAAYLLGHVAALCEPPVASGLHMEIRSMQELNDVLRLAPLRNIRDLGFSFEYDVPVDDAAGAIANCGNLASLKSLQMHITDEGLRHIAGSRHLASLETFVGIGAPDRFETPGISAEGIAYIGNSATLTHLKAIDIYNEPQDSDFAGFDSNEPPAARLPVVTAGNWPGLRLLPNFKGMQRREDGSLACTE